MPSIFRKLASLTAWVLFVFGLLSLLGGFFRITSGAGLEVIRDYLGFGVVSLFLSVVTMRLRQKME
jgi:hypothetical protein